MGGLKSLVSRNFLALVESGNIRYVAQPVGAPIAMVSDGAALAWAWAAYVQIIVAATITDPSWLVGIAIHTCAVETHNGDIAIARGAADAEVDLAIIPYAAAFAGATANLAAMPIVDKTIWLPYPVKIAGAPRLAGRIRKNTGVSAAGVSLKVILATAVGA